MTSRELRAQLQTSLGDAYRVERELGGGGMSRVFVAEEVRLERAVVVKVLSPDLAHGLSADRFEREIRTVAALQQANIVPVLTAGDTDGLPFYTMPFVEGESLRAHLARGPLVISEVVGIIKDVSKALAYAHKRGIVHRDIKPDNVLLSGGTAVVTDFGIAKAISAARTNAGAATLTQVGTSIGTPAYMAPEQAAGDTDVDQRADIYALGAMAYELLSGKPVFSDRSAQRMLAAHMSEAPRPIIELRPDTPTVLGELVMRCLAKAPSDRPETAEEIIRVLETITSSGGIQSMPPVLHDGPQMFRKALAIYAVAFVAVAMIAKAAIVAIGLPDWVFAGSLIVMGLGLPMVLWTGYVQSVTRRAMTAAPTYTPGGTPSTTHGTIASFALKAAPHLSWYRTARGGMYAFATFIALVAAVMGMRAFGIGPLGSLRGAGRLNQRDPVLLGDFRTANADSTLGRVVSDAVRAALSGSSAFALVSPATVVAALQRMKVPPTTRVDSGIARQIALREGMKAIIDGDVTGVAGGYIVAIRLVRADSGIELASFRETGEGPRGLIDAADKLARALRTKAGESLRLVNATPPLFQATTGSLEALRKYSDAFRTNLLGDSKAIDLAREAVALDSTFATAWALLGATLSNYGSARSAIDSALTQAFRFRDRLPVTERELVTARFYAMGPGRDRAKAIAAYEGVLKRGDSVSQALISLGEMLRTRREYARAETLNLAAVRLFPGNGTALGNVTELQMNQGKFRDVDVTVRQLRELSPSYASERQVFNAWIEGNDSVLPRRVDSVRMLPDGQSHAFGRLISRSIALRGGRLRDEARVRTEDLGNGAFSAEDEMGQIWLDLSIRGPSAPLVARLDSVVARVPFRELPLVDRPYLNAAATLARAGNAQGARAMIARYRSEVTDTALVRQQDPIVHSVLGEIALAENKPQEALVEFRRGDIGYDGAPASECGPCLPFNLARAFDVAGQSDSAAVMFERYLSTPYWQKLLPHFDPVIVPAIRERLGQLYESMGNTERAVENYRLFIELWKNADPELQPRVAGARRRLVKLTPVERPR